MNNNDSDDAVAIGNNVLYFFIASAFLGLITAISAMTLYLWL